MAGSYPDPPSWRMSLDRDGSQFFQMSFDYSQINFQYSNANIQSFQDDNLGSGYDTRVKGMLVMFPEFRDLDAGLIATYGNFAHGASEFQVSSDTTNGVDGTWTGIANLAKHAVAGLGKDVARTGITSVTSLGIKALRFKTGEYTYLGAVHLYGEPAPGENPKRLEIWHPTLDQRVSPAYFDWGNVPRSSTEDRQFRVKNLHSSKVAQNVRVAMDVLTDTTPSVPAQFLISQGEEFLAQQTIGDVGPGSISGALTIRRVTPSDAQLALWWHRLFAEPSSWS